MDSDQTIRFGSVRYSTPEGHQGNTLWCRVAGDELVITTRTPAGLAEIARHELSTPGNPRIAEEHYPHHRGGNLPRPPKVRPVTPEEVAFLALGEGARRWLVEAGASGVVRIRTKIARALELAAILGADRVDEALGLAAIADRFAEDDLACICDHLARSAPVDDLIRADEAHSTQPGTSSWEVFGQ